MCDWYDEIACDGAEGTYYGKKGWIEVIDSRRVFNLPLYEAFLVIDCREQEKYSDGHIASALNFPPPDAHKSKEHCLMEFAQHASNEFCNERWDPIVLYGDDTERVVRHVKWVAFELLGFIEHPPVDLQNNTFLQCLARTSKSIWVLSPGYEGFITDYPMLKHALVEHGADTMTPLPYHLSSEGNGVFLGSRGITWTKGLIEAVGIRAVVLDEVAAKRFETNGVDTPLEYFLCSLSNNDAEDKEQLTIWNRNRLEAMFESVTLFIQTAVQSHRRVLIQLQGRSVSAAIAIAWFMKYQRMRFDDARAAVFVCTLRNPADGKSTVLDKSQLLEKELRLWERSAGFAAGRN